MSDDFVAIDVETANADAASICQVGIVVFAGGHEAASWQSLLNPDDYFDDVNVGIHGIADTAVVDAPRFPDLAPAIRGYLEGRIVVSHMPFDRLAMDRVHRKYSLAPPACTWLDSARVVRRAWPQFASRGYGLANVAEFCGVDFRHHDALEDARAAGRVLLHAVAHSTVSVADWVARSRSSLVSDAAHVTKVGNTDGPLAGEVVVFTGALIMPRRDAAELAARAGCDVADTVTKKTTLLVVGDQDIRRLAGHEKSTKHRKAEQLLADGQQIRILGEADFSAMIELA
jgi:DNA polymerase-3 subunit epsilon